MLYEKIRVVLVETSHPGNIGAAARAMKTMGLSELVLVNPKRFPAAEATERAAGADDILYHAQVVDTLNQALEPARWVIGTSARPRHLAVPEYRPDEAAARTLARLEDGPVAIVFGRERSGLSNDELDRCQALVRIPTNPDFASLNLGSAVQLIAYELRRHLPDPSGEPSVRASTHANQAQLEGLFSHLERVLVQLDYLDPKNPKFLMRRLRRLIARVEPEEAEVQILRGVLRNIEQGWRKPSRSVRDKTSKQDSDSSECDQ
ncbi:MAG: RNA methyltransferase [Pseudomonadota bacterium]